MADVELRVVSTGERTLEHNRTTPVPRVKGRSKGSPPTFDAARQHLTGRSPSVTPSSISSFYSSNREALSDVREYQHFSSRVSIST